MLQLICSYQNLSTLSIVCTEICLSHVEKLEDRLISTLMDQF